MGGVVEMILEGERLEPVLREMDRSPAIRVIGPHVSWQFPGSGATGQRITIRVAVKTAAEARELVRSYLPADGDYSIRPALA